MEDTLKITGLLTLYIFEKGKLIEEFTGENLIVNGGRNAVSNLIGGLAANKYVNGFGFGEGSISAQPSDTVLTNSTTKGLDSATIMGVGQLRFAFSIAANEGNGKNISEFGLFCNDNTLFSRKVRAAITKTPDITLSGIWDIIF